MKDKWRNYALKDGKIQESYIRKYSNRSPKREAREASRRDCLLQSGEEPEEYQITTRPMILNDAWVINLRMKDEQRSNTERPPGDVEGKGSIMAMPSLPGKQNGCGGETRDNQESFGEKETISNSLKRGYDEGSREEEVVETHCEGRQGISESDKGRREAKEVPPNQTKGQKMKKPASKEKKHEAKESKAYEKKEDKKESAKKK